MSGGIDRWQCIKKVMSEKTRAVSQLADATYAGTLSLATESTHEYKVHGPYGSNFP